MRKEAIYAASADIARRAGVISSSYRTADGRFILSEHDLRSVRFSMTPEEYVTGLDVEIVSEEEAKTLIRDGGYQIGEPPAPETGGTAEAENTAEVEETADAPEPTGEQENEERRDGNE